MNDLLLNIPEKSSRKEYENSTISNVQLNYMGTMDYRRQANPYLAQTMDAVLTLKDLVGGVRNADKVIKLVKDNKIKEAIKTVVDEMVKRGAAWYNQNK